MTTLKKTLLAVAVAVLTAVFLVTSAAADTVCLKDGTKIQGRIVKESDKEVTLELDSGETATFQRVDIKSIEKSAKTPEKPDEKQPEKPDAKPAQEGIDFNKLLEILEEGKAAFTEEQVKAIMGDMVKLVEEAAGRKFKQAPKVEIADRKKVADALARDMIPQLKRLNPELGEETIKTASKEQAEATVVCLLGKYAFEDKVVYMMPKNVEPIFKLINVDMKHVESVMKVIIAHELFHALQFEDEKVVEQFESLKDVERMQAFNAVVEGQAVFIQDMVGKKLGLDEAVMETSRMMSAGALKFQDPALDFLNNILSTHFEQIYLGGRKFVEYHYKKGGSEAFWKILTQPPVSTSMITDPKTYSPTQAASKIDYKKLLEGLDKDFGEREWTVQNIEIGHMMLQAVYAGMDAKKREEVISNVEHIQGLVAQLSDGMTMATVSICKLKDAGFATKMKDALEELVKKNVERIKGSTLFELKDLFVGSYDKIKADVTSKISFNIKPVGEKGISQAFYRVFRGGVMIEIADSNIGLGDEKIVALIEKVFKRYDEAVKSADEKKDKTEEESPEEPEKPEDKTPDK